MPKPTAKKKKAKKNPTDINLLARSIVEAAIGEPLSVPKRGKAKRPIV
jgi:hypothetical protein